MKILYIHGLDSTPSPEKLDILRERGHDPVALHLDYRKNTAAYWLLRDLAAQNEVEFIIGSSLGGYFGYWLGQELGLNQLLFNPAMPFRSIHVPKTDVEEGAATQTWVVLGAHDEIIPANLNLAFFEQRPQAKVICCSWLGHRIDLETFESMLRWASL